MASDRQKKQSKRFLEAAKEARGNLSEAEFHRIIKEVAKPPGKDVPAKKDSDKA